MTCSRRDIGILVSALAAAAGRAEGSTNDILPSKCYPFDELPVKVDPKTQNESRQIFRGETHGGFEIACHETKLAPGHMPHPPHQHVNEEIFFMREGSLEITVEGKSTTIGPGSVAYIHSNEMHGAKNVGTVPAQYFVLELDGPKA